MKNKLQITTQDLAKIAAIAAVSFAPASRLREYPLYISLFIAASIFAILLSVTYRRWQLAGTAIVFLGIPSLLLLFGISAIHARQSARLHARENSCLHDVRMLTMAIANYEADHGPLPAFVPDENGKPMHSWRVLILPYVEEPFLYEDYDFSKPWDSAQNLSLTCPGWLQCTADQSSPNNFTSYVAVVGSGTAWDGSGAPITSSIRVVESPEDCQHWLDPSSPKLDDVLARPQPFKTKHKFGNVVVGFSDGDARKIPVWTGSSVWRKLFSGK